MLAIVLVVAAVAGCGDDDSGTDGPLTVSAAASLQTPLTRYAEHFGEVRLSFAGSDELAAQIRQGVKPDVFAAANATLPEALYREGLVERPTEFAGNRLVLAVPARADTVATLEEAARGGVKLAIGTASVPIGAYTRKVLARMPAADRRALLGNVRSEEPDVKGIVGKLTQGAVDAGFLYVTDVAASKGALKAIELPAALQPDVAYGVAIVKGAPHREQARRFVAGLLDGAGRDALRDAGFGPPPS